MYNTWRIAQLKINNKKFLNHVLGQPIGRENLGQEIQDFSFLKDGIDGLS